MSVTDPGAGMMPAPDEVEIEIHRGRHKSHAVIPTDISPNAGSAVTASRQILAGDVEMFYGWSIRETTGAAGASFRLRNGNGATAPVIANANLAANESIRDYWLPYGILITTGRIYLEWISGSLEGVIYWR